MTNIKKAFISVLIFGGLGLVVLIGHDNMKKQRLQETYSEAVLPDTFASTHVVSGGRATDFGNSTIPTVSSIRVHATSSSVQQRSGFTPSATTGISVAPRFTATEQSAYATVSGGSAGVAKSYHSATAASNYNTGLMASSYSTNQRRSSESNASSAVAEPFSDSRPNFGIGQRVGPPGSGSETDPVDPNTPPISPIGDGFWFLLLCCGAFVAKRRLSKRKDENAEQ